MTEAAKRARRALIAKRASAQRRAIAMREEWERRRDALKTFEGDEDTAASDVETVDVLAEL